MAGSVLIKNIGAIATGDITNPLSSADSLYIEDGVIREIGTSQRDAETIINANGLTVTPGLIDSHSHPTFGDHSPALNTISYIRAYLHGGTTSIVSAGEQHLSGLPLDPPDPATFKHLAILSRRCWKNLRPAGVKMYVGTMLVAPGMTEADWDDLQREGCTQCAKFIFYPFQRDWNEGKSYVRWAKQRGIVTKIHTGGVSRSGVSQPAFAREILELRPDVAAHLSGGPIAMSTEDMETIIRETDCWLELCSSQNYRRSFEMMKYVEKHNAWHRVIIGTDTPGGTGIAPRGIMRNVLFISGVCGVKPEIALAMATGSTAKAHHLQEGTIAVGRPADLQIMDKVFGSVAKNALQSIWEGDLPGLSCVLVDGKLVVRERAEQTPPPEKIAIVEKG